MMEEALRLQTHDHPAALAELLRRWPGVPCTCLGHSLGGQIDGRLEGREGIRRLYRLYPNAPTRFESLRPEAHGLKRRGHFGLFKPASANTLWPLALAWIAD